MATKANPQSLRVSSEQMQMASAVGPRASLAGVYLMSVNATREGALGALPKYVRHSRSHAFKRLVEEDRVQAIVRFGLEMASDETETKRPSIKIDAQYALIYDIQELSTLDDAHIDAFAQINGSFNAWPFWRELSGSLLGRVAPSALAVPTLKVETAKRGSKGGPSERVP